jgi:gliding motility-associated lipoprotein GldD
MNIRTSAIFAAFAAWVLCSCGRQPVVPKPMGYFRIDFPDKKYTAYTSQCPYGFHLPHYALAAADKAANAEPCWLNIVMPELKATIHLSFKNSEADLAEHISDSRALAYKHSVKADAIDETLVAINDRQVYGMVYDIAGNAASPLQFYLTDSVSKFLRGALYFNAAPNKDSLAPATAFIREDIIELIETFNWKLD